MAANLSGAPDDAGNLIHVAAIDSKEDRALIPAYSNTIYASSLGASEGHLLFYRDGSLFAQPFEPKRLRTAGQLHPIAQRVASYTLFWREAIFCAAENGTIAYGTEATSASTLLWFDRNGRPLGTVGEPELFVAGAIGWGGGKAVCSHEVPPVAG